MSIHQNLRTLRISKGMTQEQAAEKLNVTRQTISSYESGRTRPDVETLVRLSQLYGVPLEQVLYGPEPALRKSRQFQRLACGLAGLVLLFLLLRSALMCATNILLPVGLGLAAEQLQTRWQLIAAWEFLTSCSLALAELGFPVLLVLELVRKPPISLAQRGIFAAAFLGGLAAVTLPFACFDPVYPPPDYLLPLLSILVYFLGSSALAALLRLLQRRRQSAQASQISGQ